MKKQFKWYTVVLSVIIIVAGIFIIFDNKYNKAWKIVTPNNTPESRTIAVFVDEEPHNPDNLKKIKIATITVKISDGDLTLNPIVDDTFNIARLSTALNEIRKRPVLELTVENFEMIDGGKALVMKAVSVSKNDLNYIWAVRDTLTMEFGLNSEIEK